MHDPRVGRFFAIDPLAPKYPWYTPYQFSGNRAIDMVELEGCEPATPGTKEGEIVSAKYVPPKDALLQDEKYQPTLDWYWHQGTEYTNKGWYSKGNYKLTQLDYKNGQVLEPLGFWDKFPSYVENNREYLGFRVNDDGYIMYWGNQDSPIEEVKNKPFQPSPDPTMLFGGSGVVKNGITLMTTGRSIWSLGVIKNNFKNAILHFNKHGHEFGFKKAKEYITATHKFISNVPSGTKIKMVSKDEIIMYNPNSNTFLAMKINGTPKTMFKPNLTYINNERIKANKETFDSLEKWWDSQPSLQNMEWISK